MKLVFILYLAITGAFAQPAGGQDVTSVLKRLESPDQKIRDGAVTALAELGPGRLEAIASQSTLFLGPRFMKLNEEGKMPKDDPVLERILGDLGRALAAMGPKALDTLTAWAIAGDDGLESELSYRALKILGPEAKSAIPAFKAAMESDNSKRGWGGMVGLALVDGPQCPNLKEAFRSTKTELRALAVYGFGKAGSAAGVDFVLAAASDPNMEVSGAASLAMRELAPFLVPKIPQILASEGMERRAPFDMMGEAAVPILKELLFKGRQPISGRAAVALVRAGGSAMPVLAGALDHADPAVRLAAVNALGEAEGDTKPVADCLAKAWRDNDPAVRDAVLTSLYAAGDEGPRLVPLFTAGLKNPSAPERILSAMALAKLGRGAASSASELAVALDDPEGGVRSAAVQALGWIGPDPAFAITKVIPLAADKDAAVRQGAVFALGNMRPTPQIRKILIQAAEDGDVRVASEAVMSLWGYESESAGIAPVLLRSLKSPIKEVKLAVLGVLSKWSRGIPKEAESILKTIRDRDADPEAKDAARRILERLAPPAVDPSMPPPPPPPPPFPPQPPMFRQTSAGRS